MSTATGHKRRRVPEAVPEGEMWIEIHGQRDELGRVQFTTFWADDNHWRGGHGVAGQVFLADDRRRAAGWAAEGKTVRHIPEGSL
jgi:hypothetical protein